MRGRSGGRDPPPSDTPHRVAHDLCQAKFARIWVGTARAKKRVVGSAKINIQHYFSAVQAFVVAALRVWRELGESHVADAAFEFPRVRDEVAAPIVWDEDDSAEIELAELKRSLARGRSSVAPRAERLQRAHSWPSLRPMSPSGVRKAR
jgi:hypothetical protein